MWPISRSLSISQNWESGPDSPFLPALTTTILLILSVSMNLTTLGTWYRSNHAASVLLWLAYFSVLKYSSLFLHFFSLRFLHPSRRPCRLSCNTAQRMQTPPAAAGGRRWHQQRTCTRSQVTIHSLLILSLHEQSYGMWFPFLIMHFHVPILGHF